ncbi:MAG: hypothetical protein AAFQ53_12590 [Bacteroidota bacterium]
MTAAHAHAPHDPRLGCEREHGEGVAEYKGLIEVASWGLSESSSEHRSSRAYLSMGTDLPEATKGTGPNLECYLPLLLICPFCLGKRQSCHALASRTPRWLCVKARENLVDRSLGVVEGFQTLDVTLDKAVLRDKEREYDPDKRGHDSRHSQDGHEAASSLGLKSCMFASSW